MPGEVRWTNNGAAALPALPGGGENEADLQLHHQKALQQSGGHLSSHAGRIFYTSEVMPVGYFTPQ